jgi:FkbM family methyltransferase
MMRQAAVRAVRSALKPLGLTVVSERRLIGWDRAFALLRRYGLAPLTVFDIGVAEGTPELYAAFPDATYHLVEPTRESLPHMKAVAHRLNATVHNVALGEAGGNVTITVRPEIGASSLFREVGAAEIASRYRVPVRRFDELFAEPFARPALARSTCRAPSSACFAAWAAASTTSTRC